MFVVKTDSIADCGDESVWTENRPTVNGLKHTLLFPLRSRLLFLAQGKQPDVHLRHGHHRRFPSNGQKHGVRGVQHGLGRGREQHRALALKRIKNRWIGQSLQRSAAEIVASLQQGWICF